MYKPISNSNEKSLICKQVEEGKINPEQLYCCEKDFNTCSPYSSSCVTGPSKDNEVAKCYNIGSYDAFDACRRTDANAAHVCGWKDSLFCISTSVLQHVEEPRYTGFNEGVKWMVSRSNLEESFNNATACDYGKGYQLCNDTSGSVAYLTCGDLFTDKYDCFWFNNTAINDKGDKITLNRHPVGQICESTVTDIWGIGRNLALTTYIPLGIAFIGLGVITTFFYRSRKRRGERLVMRDRQIEQQQEQLRQNEIELSQLREGNNTSASRDNES